jgi:hypothetical protein
MFDNGSSGYREQRLIPLHAPAATPRKHYEGKGLAVCKEQIFHSPIIILAEKKSTRAGDFWIIDIKNIPDDNLRRIWVVKKGISHAINRFLLRLHSMRIKNWNDRWQKSKSSFARNTID